MKSTSRKSADERKSEIVDAALKLAGEVGPDRMTTEALARDINISQAGIYRHFPSKGAIWEAVGQRIGKLLQAKAVLTHPKSTEPGDALRLSVVTHLTFIETTPAIPAILFSRELHAENEKLRAFFAGLISSRHKAFSKLIAAEIEAGRFKKSIDSDDAAFLILALIQGLAMRWSLNARNFNLAEEGERLLELQLQGFRVETKKAEK
ncbi:MAG: TetR/AcrR family transcriptional regulator [Rhizobiaceae bacterium]